MSFAQVAGNLDPNDFIVVPHVAVLDEFDMTDDDGHVVARIDAGYIERTVARMNQREATTGDLAPLVIGHTKDLPIEGDEEVNGPPLVGYARNWVVGPFFDTGKVAAFADFWILKSEAARAAKFTRRSAEIWIHKNELDPISLLGATTPARDLGLMVLKLQRNGSLTVTAPVEGSLFEQQTLVRLNRQPTNRESDMADEKVKPRDDKPAAEPKETGLSKEILGMLQSLMAAVQSLTEATKSTPAAPVAPGVPEGGAGGAGAGDVAAAGASDEPMSDEELEQLLAQMDQGGGDTKPEPEDDKSRKGEEVVKNSGGYPGGDNTNSPTLVKKMAREEEDNKLRETVQVLQVKLARSEIREQIVSLVTNQNADLDPTDEALITELSILPEDVRKSMLVRLSKKKSITSNGGHGIAALVNGKVAGKNLVVTQEDKERVVKLARQKGIPFELAKIELGFDA